MGGVDEIIYSIKYPPSFSRSAAVQLVVDEDSNRGRGRPASGRKVVLQGGFESDEVEEIRRVAMEDGIAVSAALRELALAGLKARKTSGK